MSSKLGPHVMSGSAEAEELAGLGTWGKLVDNFGLAPRFKGRCVGRRVLVDPSEGGRPVTAENRRHLAPEAAARNVWGLLKAQGIDPNPAIKIWEFFNEPVLGDDLASYDWLAQVCIEAMKLADAAGVKLVIFNLSAGNPIDAAWPRLIPAVRYARDHGHFIGLHEYGGVWMWWMCGRFQKGVPQAQWSVSPGDAGFTTLRYRSVWRNHFAPLGLDDVRLFITECGLDAVGPAPDGFDAGPWRHVAGQWGSWGGSSDPIGYWRAPERDAEMYYAEQLIWYDMEIRSDSFVLAAFPFTFGATNPAWEPYNLNGTRTARRLINYVRAVAGQVDPAPQPLPAPRPTPRLKVGDRAQVTPGPILNIRSEPGGQDIGDLHPGDIIVIRDGPGIAAAPGETKLRVWWLHDKGWSMEDRLQLAPPEPTPEPTPTPEPEPMPEPTTQPSIPNPSFEKPWLDVGPEQQEAEGWTLVQTAPGQVMGIPEKHSGGIKPDAKMVPAIAQARAEVVHKGRVPDKDGTIKQNLPDDEMPGQRRALILSDGGQVDLKVFWGLPNESKLVTVVRGVPGQVVRVVVPILGESNLTPELPNTKLEDDNWWATAQLGLAIDRRNYAEMVSVLEVEHNDRHWNKFVVVATLPASGELPLSITLQDNWGRTDWFIDALEVELVTAPAPIPTGPTAAEVAAAVADIQAARIQLGDVAERIAKWAK